MKNIPHLLISLVSLCLLVSIDASAERRQANWYLPQKLSDANMQIEFEVDSTWHTVHGKTSSITGHARLSKSDDPTALDILIELPVAMLNTADEDRDAELRSIMAVDQYPTIRLNAANAPLRCVPAAVVEQGQCSDTLMAKLTIRATTTELEVPIVIRAEPGRFAVSGTFKIRWAEYGVEDPSIFLIATVDPIVEIKFKVQLSATDAAE